MVNVESVNKLLPTLSREELVYAVLASHPVEEGVVDIGELEIRVLDAADTFSTLATLLLPYGKVGKKELNILGGVIFEKVKEKEIMQEGQAAVYLTSHAKREFIRNLEKQEKDHPRSLLRKLGEYVWKN